MKGLNRQLGFVLFGCLGLLLIGLGLLIPAHLRAVDARVLSKSSNALVAEGLSLAKLEKPGPAQLLLEAAQREEIPGREALELSLQALALSHPELRVWGGADPYLDQVFDSRAFAAEDHPVLHLLVLQESRQQLLRSLSASRRPAVAEIVRTRTLTKMSLFPPAGSTAGRALDATIFMTALLFQGDHFSPGLRDAVERLCTAANRGESFEPMERIYFDLLSLGKRLNWAQMAELIAKVENPEALRVLGGVAREMEADLPVVFSAIQLSGSAAAVADYITEFGQAGIADLSHGFHGGREGLALLLEKGQPVHYGRTRESVLAFPPFAMLFAPLLKLSQAANALGVALKLLLFLAGGFLLAHAALYWGAGPSAAEQQMKIKRISLARQGLFAVAFLIVAVALGEPHLARGIQKFEPTLRVQLPAVADTTSSIVAETKTTQSTMDQYTILAVAVFLVLQGLLYVLCLVKLAEIRRQPISNQLKLQLLENEENLFDAGLYCGLGGTVFALVFLALGILKPSLVAAYSSTLFGVVFVGLFKICHLRPLRRKLLVEIAAQSNPQLPEASPAL